MGRGTSKSGVSVLKSVRVQSGNTVDLSDTPLVYGKPDATITGAQRKTLEEQEKKRLDAKVEYGMIVDENGLQRGMEKRGGKNSVKMPYSYFEIENATMTHNHPRGIGEENNIGGTFSSEDLDSFTKHKIRTMRASAAEGTYSISKTNKFDANGFDAFQKKVSSDAFTTYKKAAKEVKNQHSNGSIDAKTANGKIDKLFNKMLVDVHNELLSGQKKYGYTYTLEMR